MMNKRTTRLLLAVTLIGLILFGVGYSGYHQYKILRHTQLIKQARTFLAKSNWRKASLCLQRALRYNPKDPEACHLMAELTESLHDPSTLLWQMRAVEVNPRSLEDRLALAQTAISLRDYSTATNALDGVDEAEKKTAAYHNVAGSVAAAAGHLAEAESHFLEAERLEPQNPVPQLNMAVVRLHGTNAAAQAEGRVTLKQLSSNPANSFLRCEALRELTLDAMRNRQTNAALAMSEELLQQTNSAFQDRLLRLTVLQETRNSAFKPSLATFQREAAGNTTNVAEINELGVWLMAKLGPADAITWLRSLPPNVQTNQPVAMLLGECYIMQKDWGILQKSLEHQNWGDLEFVRLAFTSLALRGQDLAAAATGEWDLALKSANGQKTSLIMLLRLATQWNWEAESENVLWAIVNRYPEEKWAAQALTQTLFDGGRTRSLMQLLTLESRRFPSTLSIKNDLAFMALLLNATELKPHELAREVYEKSSTNSSFASTFAFSLYLQKQPAEALKVIEQIPPKDLNSPLLAGCYAMILKANGHPDKAKTYFDLSAKARLLPEERRLIDRARNEG